MAPLRPSIRNMDAYDLYLQGRTFWHQRYGVGLQRGLEFFQKAAALDSEFALPYTGISDAFVALGLYGFLPSKAGRKGAGEAGSRALGLDPLSYYLASMEGAVAYLVRDFRRAPTILGPSWLRAWRRESGLGSWDPAIRGNGKRG